MATPYLQIRLDSVASTQDEAKYRLDRLPVVVMTGVQTKGRGRSGAAWLSADRALAASVALRVSAVDQRPFSLMAGIAAARVVPGARLKWPNDVMTPDGKAGGVLVERTGEVMVVGLGLNLWWSDAPEGMAAVFDDDPGPERQWETGGMWAAALLSLVAEDGWPVEEYRSLSDTIGRTITWEPDGSGDAVDIADDGGLVVRRDGIDEILYSGAVRYVRG